MLFSGCPGGDRMTSEPDQCESPTSSTLPGEASPGEFMRRGSALIALIVGIQLAANLGFWVLASHLVPTDDLGDAGVLFTSLQFIVYLAGLGLTVTNSRFGTDNDADAHGLFTWSLLAVVCATAVGVSVFLVGLTLLIDHGMVESAVSRDLLGNSASGIGTLYVLAAGTAIALLVDVRLMALRRYDLLTGRAVLVGALRIPLLYAEVTSDAGLGVFVAAALPTFVYAISGVVALPRLTALRYHLRPPPGRYRRFVRFASVNYLATLLLEAPQFTLPVVVGLWVGGDEYANFFVAWGAAAAVLLLPAAVAQVSLVEGARDEGADRSRQRETMLIAIGIAVAALVGSIVANDLVTIVYGSEYRRAAELLPYFVAAAVPWAVTTVLLTEARIEHDHTNTVAITVCLGFSTLLPAMLLVPDSGIDGAVAAWLGGNLLTAAVAVAGAMVRARSARSVVTMSDAAPGNSPGPSAGGKIGEV